MTLFVVMRFHQDRDGNFRNAGQRLELPDEAAIPYRKRGFLMTPEEAAAQERANAEKRKNATYEFHHYERP